MTFPPRFPHRWLDFTLITLWTIAGAALRFTNLTAKPPWTDEFATLVFSLGHSFLTIPLDRVMDSATLLEPLQTFPKASFQEVLQHLFAESNHPPLYYLLTHAWLQLFPTSTGWVSLWAARSIAALIGVVLIPASFALGWMAFRSRLVAHFAAIGMAVSPFAIYLSQEARHYTLPVLWIVASFACLALTVRSLDDQKPLPLAIALVWVIVNALGMATHYFFALTLGLEALVLLAWLMLRAGKKAIARRFNLGRIGAVAMGTVIGGLVWLPFLQGTQENDLTRWIYESDRAGLDWIAPIGELLAGWVTMLYLLPIQSSSAAIAIGSGILLVLLFLGTIALLWQGWRFQNRFAENRPALFVFFGIILAAIGLFLGISYGAGIDLTSAFRYSFVYFPAVVMVVAAGLAGLWQMPTKRPIFRVSVVAMLIFALLGSLTVITNLGYQKTHRPDIVTAAIWEQAQRSPHPLLVAIAHRTHGQTGRLMAIAWEWQRLNSNNPAAVQSPEPQFLLVQDKGNSRQIAKTFQQAIDSIPVPFDLWLINVQTIPQKTIEGLQQRCSPESESESVDGYEYQQYHCETTTPIASVSSSTIAHMALTLEKTELTSN